MRTAIRCATCACVSALVASLFFSLSYAQEYPYSGIVTESKVNVRSDATTSAAVIMTLKAQERVTVRAKWYDWYKIDLPSRADAFVRADLASLATDYSVTITKEHVNVRASPSESSAIIGKASSGDTFALRRLVNGWYKIVPGSCCTGWVNERFVKKAPPEPEAVIQPVTRGTATPETPAPLARADGNQPPGTLTIETRVSGHPPAPAAETAMSRIRTNGNQPRGALTVGASVSAQPPAAPKGAITIEGIVRSYGKVWGRKAAYKLVTKDKRTYLLVSPHERLKAAIYHKVRVTATPVESAGPYPLLEVVSLETID